MVGLDDICSRVGGEASARLSSCWGGLDVPVIVEGACSDVNPDIAHNALLTRQVDPWDYLNVRPVGSSSRSSDDSNADRAVRGGYEHDYSADVRPLPGRQTALIHQQEWISVTMAVAMSTPKVSQALGTWLQEALQQMAESREIAVDEGLSPPSDIVIRKTEALLHEMSGCIGSVPDVYPMHDSSLAIDFRTPDGRSGVLFIIDQDGSGALFYPTRGQDGWTSVEDATDLFKGRGADELKRAGIR